MAKIVQRFWEILEKPCLRYAQAGSRVTEASFPQRTRPKFFLNCNKAFRNVLEVVLMQCYPDMTSQSRNYKTNCH